MREACRFILTEVLFHPMSLVYQVVIARSRECTVAEESPIAESCMAESLTTVGEPHCGEEQFVELYYVKLYHVMRAHRAIS